MSVNCFVFGSQYEACRPLLVSGNHSANLFVALLHHDGFWLLRIFDVIHTRPLLSSIGLCGSAGTYGGFAQRCSSPQCSDGRNGGGKRDGTFSRGSRVGISSATVLFSFGSRTTSWPWPAETA